MGLHDKAKGLGMKLTQTMKETNKWLHGEPTAFEKALQIILMIFAATIFMGAMMK
ncbi:hypothetical protein [Pectinatus frisingensis]|uniref:hypothetical protein n=1 Tax=Pectinatus frisingensis TaxID=865 RepID=UPI0018C49E8F|nr:hypothetical protein [Pectinatus frisingensis]